MMGDIAEMMLDGTLCAECGQFLGGEGEGFPRYCTCCKRGRGSLGHFRARAAVKVKCPTCGKLVKKAGLTDHQRDAHGVKSGAT